MRPSLSHFLRSLILGLGLIFLTYSAAQLYGQQPPSDKTQAQTSTNVAFVGVNAQRTRVYNSTPISLPTTVIWKTGMLFESDASYSTVATWEGLPGKPTSVLKLPSGHSFTDLLIADGVLYFSIYINDGYLIAQEAKTGADKWRFKIKKLGVSAPAIAGGSAFIGAS